MNKKYIMKRITSIFALSIFLFNSYFDNNVFATYIYAKSEDTWIENLESMPTPRRDAGSVSVGDNIYVIGGQDSNGYSSKVEVYNTKEDMWVTKSDMPIAKSTFGISIWNNKIYCVGGYNGSRLNTLEVYDINTDTWETKNAMPTKRNMLTANIIDGKMYAIGGQTYNTDVVYLDTVECYDIKTDAWTTKTPLNEARRSHASSVFNEQIYVFAGFKDDAYINSVECYDPISNSWTNKAVIPNYIGYITSSIGDDYLYVIGGRDGSNLSTVYEYNPNLDSWTQKADMPTARMKATASTVDGRIYCFGGEDTSILGANEAYVFRLSDTEQAINSVELVMLNPTVENLSKARNMVNLLGDSPLKDTLQDNLNSIGIDITLDKKSATANMDIYIKSENMLSLSLNTNNITFDGFSGVEDIEKLNAVNLTVSSSLPYEVNAYLAHEIQNASKSNTMDKRILNIKANSELSYMTFADTVNPIMLLDSQLPGNNIIHGIDLKLKGNIAHEKDVYKTTIKFEVKQK